MKDEKSAIIHSAMGKNFCDLSTDFHSERGFDLTKDMRIEIKSPLQRIEKNAPPPNIDENRENGDSIDSYLLKSPTLSYDKYTSKDRTHYRLCASRGFEKLF